MMKNVINLVLGILVVMMISLAGCGGGGGGATNPVVANTTSYPTSKILPSVATSTTSFTLTGSDTSGGSWTGSMQMRGDGPTVFEGQNVTKMSQAITLTLAGGSTASSTIASYYKSDGVLYKSIY